MKDPRYLKTSFLFEVKEEWRLTFYSNVDAEYI